MHIVLIMTLLSFFSYGSISQEKPSLCDNKVQGRSSILYIFVDGKTGYSKKTILHVENWTENGTITQPNFGRSAVLANIIVDYHDTLLQNDFAYFPQRNSSKVLKCVKKMIDSVDYQEIRIFSYSHGFQNAALISKLLNKHNIKISHFVSVDPVSKNLIKLSKNLFSSKSYSPNFIINAERWLNFFQKSDQRTFLVGVKGNSYPKAHLNIQVKAGVSGHNNIFNTIFSNPHLQSELDPAFYDFK